MPTNVPATRFVASTSSASLTIAYRRYTASVRWPVIFIAHQRHLEWAPSRITGWAQTIGPPAQNDGWGSAGHYRLDMLGEGFVETTHQDVLAPEGTIESGDGGSREEWTEIGFSAWPR